MVSNIILKLIVHLILTFHILCAFDDADFINMKVVTRRIKAKLFFSSLIDMFINTATNKIKNNSIRDEDALALFFLNYELARKFRSLKTPPVYWYLRKG